jgi:ABC-type multidrug transport system ATPase subunit
MMHILEADSIWLEFGIRKILTDIYIKCESGKITGLLGRNGEGKTCLLNIIYGTLGATNKSVRIDGNSTLEAYKEPGLLLYLPQFNFVPKHLSLKRLFRDFNLEYANFVMTFPEFQDHYNSSIGNLSGGQRRLVEIYLIIKSRAKFCLLDEPFTHIMPIHAEKIKELLMEEKLNKGILFTDHMFNHITDISDYLFVLKEGKTYLTKKRDEIEELGYAKVF